MLRLVTLRLEQLDGFCQQLQGQVDLERGPLFLGALLRLERHGWAQRQRTKHTGCSGNG
jgi:hypothetical protein